MTSVWRYPKNYVIFWFKFSKDLGADTDADRQIKTDFIEAVVDESSEGRLGAGRWLSGGVRLQANSGEEM